MTVQEQAQAIAKILEDKKAEKVRTVHVGEKTIIADYFVICSGRSVTHVKSLCDEVEEKVEEQQLGLKRLRIDGYDGGRWIVLDYGNILVHIFHPEEREYYDLEEYWETKLPMHD